MMLLCQMGQRPSLSDASRPSQRVDYSSYVHDDDGIPFIENKLPHDTHPEIAVSLTEKHNYE